MSKKPIFLLFTSLSFFLFFSQEKNVEEKSVKINTKELVKDKKSDKSKSDFFIGIDIFNPIYGLLTDKKGYEARLSYQKKFNWAYVIEIGTEQNVYQQNSWDIGIKGPYVRLGVDKFLIVDDYTTKKNGFYVGLRAAFSRYNRNPRQVPIRASDGSLLELATLPEEDVNAFWMEIPLGARVDVYKNKLFIDFSVRPKILLGGSTGESGIENITIPGFGLEQSGLNFGANWSLVYNLAL